MPTGTYNQMRLMLSDTSADLEDSAQSAGAQFNNEVDYFDANAAAPAGTARGAERGAGRGHSGDAESGEAHVGHSGGHRVGQHRDTYLDLDPVGHSHHLHVHLYVY